MNGQVSNVEDYNAVVSDAEAKKCGWTKLEAREKKLFKKLEAVFLRQAQDQLQKVAEKLKP